MTGISMWLILIHWIHRNQSKQSEVQKKTKRRGRYYFNHSAIHAKEWGEYGEGKKKLLWCLLLN